MIYCAWLGAAMGRLGTGDWLSLDSGQRARSYLAHNIALAVMGERTFQTILRNAVSRLYWWGVKPVTVGPDSFPFRFDSIRLGFFVYLYCGGPHCLNSLTGLGRSSSWEEEEEYPASSSSSSSSGSAEDARVPIDWVSPPSSLSG